VASSVGKLLLVPLQSFVFAAHGRNLFWFLFSHHLLMPHFGGWLFLVPLSQQLLWPHLAGSCFWFLFSQFFFAASGGNLFWYLFSQHLLMPHLGGRLVFGSF